MDHLASVSEQELLAELNKDNLKFDGSYGPLSPDTPDVSSEGRFGGDSVRYSTAVSGRSSRGVSKVTMRLKNRRCRQKPVR